MKEVVNNNADTNQRCDEIMKENEKLRSDVNQLENESGYLYQKSQYQTFREDQQEQYSRVNSLRVYNINPTTAENEDTTEVALKCFKEAGVVLSRDKVDVSHRVKGSPSKQASIGLPSG